MSEFARWMKTQVRDGADRSVRTPGVIGCPVGQLMRDLLKGNRLLFNKQKTGTSPNHLDSVISRMPIMPE